MTAIAEENPRVNELQCSKGHGFVKTLAKMSAALFNMFTSNYASEANSNLHASSGYMASPSTTRSKGRDKISKLTSSKKH